MFTGLIEEIGHIRSINRLGNSIKFEIESKKILNDLKIDDSVAINGVCLTVTDLKQNSFIADAVDETLRKTTFSRYKINQSVNLERALMLSSRLGGHIVLGHIDTIGKILEIQNESLGILFKVSFPAEFNKFVVKVGSICIDGVSLTISDLFNNSFRTSVIPHTFNNTIFREYKIGTVVNLEFDILGKYIEKLTTGKSDFEDKLKSFLSE
jgi:riboflavin synthase